jgi:predicted RNA methylase
VAIPLPSAPGAQRLRSLRYLKAPSFVRSAPSAQAAIDAVPDAWASQFPPSHADLRAGQAALFEDPRISWGFERLGGVEGKTVLELGPLEGAHSYMAQAAGARHVTAVETNRNAFLKCLVVKELLALDRCSFLCGDALAFMTEVVTHYDLCIACGILYHMVEPLGMIDLISQRADRLLMWTHFYDDAARENKRLVKRLGPATEATYNGFSYHVHRHNYGFDARFAGFCGGTRPYSNWLPREDLLRALAHFGWRGVEIAFEDLRHVNGPALALVATKT